MEGTGSCVGLKRKRSGLARAWRLGKNHKGLLSICSVPLWGERDHLFRCVLLIETKFP